MEIEAFVLIGGKSSRLGQDKALLKIDGKTFAQRTVDTIREAFPSANISLAAREENQFSAAGLPKDVPVIFDTYKDRGAYSGLHAALNAAKSEWIFVLACDLPFVTAGLLKFMAERIDKVCDAVVAEQPDGRVQPLCAFYKTAPGIAAVDDLLLQEEKLPPLRAIFEKIDTRFIRFDEISDLPGSPNFFFNLNSPEDLSKARGD